MPAIEVNRAPVLALWAAVVAERLGRDENEALSLGEAVAGLNAQSKGRTLGLFHPRTDGDGKPTPRTGLGEECWVEVCGRHVPAIRTEAGLRAVAKDKPIDPEQVRKYLRQKFGDSLEAVRDAMRHLADRRERDRLAADAYALYERFRPSIPAGTAGWGAKGTMDLDRIRALAEE